jgi:hypothetical protein
MSHPKLPTQNIQMALFVDTPSPKQKRKGNKRQQNLINEIMAERFPNGRPPGLTPAEAKKAAQPGFKKRGWKLPGLDSFARYLGRR